MGILTLLRNAFGRSRKARATEAEGAERLPAQSATPEPAPALPEPRQSDSAEHDLVSAAFDNVKVPAQTTDPDTGEGTRPEATPEHPEPEPTKTPEPKTEPTPEPAPQAEADVQEEPQPEATPEPTPKAETEAEPKPATEPKPKAETEAEPAAEATVEPEPKTEAEAEAAPTAEATAEPTPAAEAETTVEPEPKAEAEAEAEPAAEATVEPAAEAAVEPTPKAEATVESAPEAETAAEGGTAQDDASAAPSATQTAEVQATQPTEPEPADTRATAPQTTDPQAADGEDAPQAAPAPDDETRTGGAGGNTDAEGEAEADPQATETGGNTNAEGEAEAEPDPQQTGAVEHTAPPTVSAKPATPLTKVKSRTPSLTTAYKAATAALKKTDLTGTRAKLYLVLDRSASMRPYYKDGSAQALADQTLALAAHLDPEATVHVVFFSTEVDGTTDLTLAPGHETHIDDTHATLGRMGRTSYHAAVEAVLAHHEKHTGPNTETATGTDTGTDAGKSTGPGTPALVIFQTDGAPDAKTPATASLTEAAKNHPSVFFSFVAFGEHDNKAFDYLRKLKTDNTSFFHAGPTPRELTDTELYEGVLANWRP
ncbi:VWA domain-containing protein [Streptomyces actinomycinicus]|uniref:VWA domain-containing protein n=1 Tax=Streptomyces actinomycinicus TaxID=1695166 RepID=A0A937EIJ3_9ACTN|nr:VWA domain-containing protein [Streptomyces actinomycinicus]MBL1083153.1 VWA domain-containing protein [Streptomyces actinomycinicus]